MLHFPFCVQSHLNVELQKSSLFLTLFFWGLFSILFYYCFRPLRVAEENDAPGVCVVQLHVQPKAATFTVARFK